MHGRVFGNTLPWRQILEPRAHAYWAVSNKPQLTDLIFCCPYYNSLEGEPNIVDYAKLVLCIIEITINNDPNNNEQE